MFYVVARRSGRSSFYSCVSISARRHPLDSAEVSSLRLHCTHCSRDMSRDVSLYSSQEYINKMPAKATCSRNLENILDVTSLWQHLWQLLVKQRDRGSLVRLASHWRGAATRSYNHCHKSLEHPSPFAVVCWISQWVNPLCQVRFTF